MGSGNENKAHESRENVGRNNKDQYRADDEASHDQSRNYVGKNNKLLRHGTSQERYMCVVFHRKSMG
jgi:hypothetical protein